MIIDNTLIVSQAAWDKTPADARAAMQKSWTVRVLSDVEWKKLGELMAAASREPKGQS